MTLAADSSDLTSIEVAPNPGGIRSGLAPPADGAAAVVPPQVRALLSRPRFRVLVSVSLLAILLGGAVLRLANLGGPNFGADEILHVYAAQGLIEGTGPLLPSGERYTRSFMFTRAVTLAGRLAGDVNEFSARLPSAVFGCLTILMVFVIAARWFSAAAGLVAAAVMAIAPMQIAFSRQVRMYALFQLLYVCIVFLLFEGFETNPPRRQRFLAENIAARWQQVQIRPALLVLAAPLLILALQTHQLTLPALLGPASYVVCMAGLAPFRASVSRWARLKYAITAGLIIVGAIAFVALDIGYVRRKLYEALTFVPAWAASNTENWRFYLYHLASVYPVIFGTLLISGMYSLTRNFKAALYLLLCFGVPFLIQSFAFAWKDDRYLFHLMPLMFIVFGASASAVVAGLYRALHGSSARYLRFPSRGLAASLIAAGLGLTFVMMPELRQGMKLHTQNVGQFVGVQHYSWKNALAFIAAHASHDDVIVTSRALLTHYYGPPLLLYSMNNDNLNFDVAENRRNSEGWLIDSDTGSPMIEDLAGLEHVISRNLSGWFVTERKHLGSPYTFPSDFLAFVAQHFREVRVPDADDIAVYRWEPAARRLPETSASPRVDGHEPSNTLIYPVEP